MSAVNYTVEAMGSADDQVDVTTAARVQQLGTAIAQHGCTLLTGACPGLPDAAVRGAKTARGLLVGISPGLS
jgi:predicted Rossmann-fold nucleotide-binding protein